MNKIWNNKWMIAFLATAVLLIAAVTVAIVIGVSSRPTPPPEYTEGEEVGVYYHDVADGEILLTLSGGNKFTYTGPRVNKTGTYTIDADGNVVLDFVRDEDGSASATLNADKITLTYEGSTMSFVKKINYAVTFQVNGGSAISPATVVNGKTANKPQDPARAGYVFLGWYEDEALTKLFDFSSQTITADTTLYARWIENPVGVGSYTVAFDLGYEGAPAIDAISTINGILPYGAPAAPARDGYTFAGWWISMYDDASKLSYAYTDDTTFTSNTTLYAVWTQNGGSKLASPLPTVSSNAISWSTVNGAISYQVTMVAPNGATVLNETTGSTTVSFDFGTADAGDYVISVVAVAADAANSSDAANRYVANKALDKVSYFDIIDGTLIFGSVKNATTYLVTVDCGNDAHDHTLFNNGASTSFSIINCPMQVGGIKITVVAQATGYASSTSETFVYDRTLPSVPSVIYDKATDSFIWDAVAGAKSYIVTLIVNGTTYNFDNGNKNTFSIAGYTGDIAIGVTPVNPGFNSPAATTAAYEKVTPATPNGVTVNGTIVSWNASEDADSYIIKIGSIVRTASTTSYDLSAENLEIGVEYAISVQAVKGVEMSSFSTPVNYGYRKMAGDLVYKNGVVSWTPVIGVTSYRVMINGDSKSAMTVSTNYAAITLTKEGVNTIQVKFLDFGGSDWISLDVNAYSITYMPRNGQSEYTEYVVPGDTMTLPRSLEYTGYVFTNWYSSPAGAAGNGKLYAQGSVFEEQGSIVLFADWNPITYEISIQTEGYSITNITNGAIYPATYTKNFTLPVPETSDETLLNFAGWFTGPAGSGVQLTDAKGNSVAPYGYTRDNIAYPFYDTGVLAFTLRSDNTYSVSAGPNINTVSNVTVPNTYNGLPVSTILENGFAYRSKLVTINIPNSIKLIGTGAFTQCTALTDINVYEVEGNHDVRYFDHDGALLYKDMGIGPVYLEVFPRGKTGTYVMSDDVEIIRDKTFNYSNISKLVIGKGVTSVARYAFYYCKQLTDIEFADDRTNAIVFDRQSFVGCGALTSLELPATFNMENADLMAVLTSLSKLDTITVEQGNVNYSMRGQMLTNASGTKIIYCPRSYSGVLSVPVGTQEIGDKAFSGCTAITDIIIPAHVQVIGSEAFSGCTAAVGVTFEGNRRTDLTIGTKAFSNLKAAKSVTFEGSTDGVLDIGKFTIGEKAFYPGTDSTGAFASDIKTLTFGDGANVEAIGAYAFAELPNLDTINYGEGSRINSIGDYAFSNVKKIRIIEIPGTTTSVGTGAYKGCSNVSEININEGAEEIDFGSNAFQNCTAVTKIYLPATVSDFNGSAFDGCNNIERIEVSKNNPYLWNDDDGVLYRINTAKDPVSLIFYPKSLVSKNAGVVNNIPATVTEIEASIFASNDLIKEITIGKNVTKIGDRAFANCTSLEKVTFESGRTSLVIGNSAFSYCTKLVHGAKFTLPSCTTAIGDYAFEYCKFTAFTLPEDLETIGYAAFQRNTSLKSITIPLKVHTIGDKAFNYCSQMTTFTVQKGTANNPGADLTIGTVGSGIAQADGVFYSCSRLKTVNFGDRVTVIGDYAFVGLRGTNNYSSLTLSDKLVEIGMQAFFNNKMTSVTIPNTVEYIGSRAFGAQSANSTYAKMTSINFEANGTAPLSIKTEAFYNQMNITSITLPARTSDLGALTTLSGMKYYPVNSIFKGMSKLASIKMEAAPEGVTPAYASIDGVLYAIDDNGVASTLLFCPPANPGTSGVLTVPKEVRVVNRYAFNDITKLTTIKFEEYAKGDANYGKPLLHIGNETDSTSAQNTLYGAIGGQTSNSITRVEFPSHLGHIASCGITDTKNSLTLVFNPDTTSVRLGARAFYKCKATSIDIKNVSSIGIYAFEGCNKATSISFTSKNLASIPNYVFKDCSSLQSYTVPASIKTIGTSAFQGCSNLKTVNFEEGSLLETINDKAFFRCARLESINLSACKYLARLGTNVTGESGVFQECKSLVNVDLSGCMNLVQIGTSSFKSCTGLKTFVFPLNMQTIGYDILMNCTALETVTISKNFSPAMLNPTVTADSRSILFGCTSLKKVIVPDNNPFFTTDDSGAVYDKQKTIIYFFPAGADTTNYVMPTTVREITPYAFAFYSGDSITLHEGLEVIGTGAFYFNKFETITIPSTVRKIGNYAFTVDNSLKNNTTTISSTTFQLYSTEYLEQDKSNLKSVIFADNSVLKEIGDYAFYLAYKLEYVNLPDSLEKMGTWAFYSNKALSEIILPASLEELKEYAFYECPNLAKITMQEGLESIGYSAFSYIGTNVTGGISLTIPSSVRELGNYLFSYSANLVEINLDPDGDLETIGTSAFQNTQIEELVVPAAVHVFSSSAVQGVSTLKSIEFTGTLLTEISEYTFSGCTALENVILPAGVTAIGEGAFGAYTDGYFGSGNMDACVSLKSIVIPSTVVSIGNSAFDGCTALESVIFESGCSVAYIGDNRNTATNVFRNTTNLKTVVLPDTVEVIGGHAFENSGVETINLPSSLTAVGDYAFANCDGLKKVDLFSNVSYIGNYAFYDCDNLEQATPAFGTEYIGALAFANCEKLTEAFIPATVTELVGNPYVGCSGLKSFDLDKDNAFYFMDEVGAMYDITGRTLIVYPVSATAKEFEIPDTVTTVASGAFAGATIEKLTIPARIVTIEPNTFQNLPNLTSVEIKTGITSIGDYAFENCPNLNNVVIPSTVRNIGNYAFANCTSLNNFKFEDVSGADEAYAIGTHLFDGCTSMTSIILPNHWRITSEDASANRVTNYVEDTTSEMYHVFPSYMFANTGIVNAVIPANVGSLKTSGVFANCAKLETVTFEGDRLDNIVIGGRFFYNCAALEELILPPTLEDLDPWISDGETFANCTSLKRLIGYHPASSKSAMVPEGAKEHFINCVNLEQVTIYEIMVPKADEESFEYIVTGEIYHEINAYNGQYANMFKGCTSLKKFNIKQWSYLAPGMFEGCTGIETLTIFEAMKYYGGAFKNCTNIESLYLYLNYTSFGKAVFEGWTSEQNIYIMNATRDEVASGLWDDGTGTSATTIEDIFIGCEANVYFKDDILALDNINIVTFNSFEASFYNGDPTNYQPIPAFPSLLGAGQSITFTHLGYEDLAKVVKNTFFNTEAKIYDKDGNEIVYDAATDSAKVIDKDGKVIAIYAFAFTTVDALTALNLASYADLKSVHFIDYTMTMNPATYVNELDPKLCTEIIALQNGNTEFAPFKGIAAGVKFSDMKGNSFVINNTTGMITEIDLYPSYYSIGYDWITQLNTYVSTLNKISLAGVSADVVVRINTQTYEDVIGLPVDAFANFAGCNATVTDKDGNFLYFDATSGEITKVVAPDGVTVIYTPPVNA